MEADISIWQKTGHFYFALTAIPNDSVLRILACRHSKRGALL